MLRYRNNDGCTEELDPQKRDDVIRLVKENRIRELVFDENNIDDAEILLDQVRKIFGRTSDIADRVCHELEKLHAFDLDL